MAKIIWHEQALIELDSHLEYASIEFGKKTVLRWKQEITAFEESVKKVDIWDTRMSPTALVLRIK